MERFKDVEGGGRGAERRGTMPLFANKDICFFSWEETKEFTAWRERKRDVFGYNAPETESLHRNMNQNRNQRSQVIMAKIHDSDFDGPNCTPACNHNPDPKQQQRPGVQIEPGVPLGTDITIHHHNARDYVPKTCPR